MNQNYYTTNPVHQDLFQEQPLQYASFGKRFGAALIDGLILLVPNIFLSMYYPEEIWSNLLSIAISWLYFAIQESGPNQATVGKRALGIKVTNENGEAISFGRATGRHFGKLISSLILLIGYFMMLWDDKKQTLHDKMAATLVVEKEQGLV